MVPDMVPFVLDALHISGMSRLRIHSIQISSRALTWMRLGPASLSNTQLMSRRWNEVYQIYTKTCSVYCWITNLTGCRKRQAFLTRFIRRFCKSLLGFMFFRNLNFLSHFYFCLDFFNFILLTPGSKLSFCPTSFPALASLKSSFLCLIKIRTIRTVWWLLHQ